MIFAAGVTWLAAIAALAFVPEQSDFPAIIALYSLAFLAYAWLVRRGGVHWKSLLYLSLGVRALLVFSFPNLSDDVYRFIWDGKCWQEGIHPFAYPPSLLAAGGWEPELFARLNSPDYFTVYPPLAQGTFFLSVWLSPDSWYGASVVMKIFSLFFETGTLFLLTRLLADRPEKILWYALNPLIVVELMGNLHFEAALVFFTALALYLHRQGRHGGAALAWAGAVASKLLPLMFFPLLIRRLGWKKSVWFFIWTGLAIALLFLPLLHPAFLEGMRSSLGLYFRRFEFNAPLYHLLKSPFLPAITLFFVLIWLWKERRPRWDDLPQTLLYVSMVYLLTATTVHPWYLTLPVFFCLFTPYRFPLVWSAVAPLTYATYQCTPYRENYWLAGLEYLVLLMAIGWDWRRIHR